MPVHFTPEPLVPELAGFTAGFGLLIVLTTGGLVAAAGFASGDPWAWGIAGCTFLPIAGVGVGLVGLGGHFWRLRREPLVVEGGTVSYRGRVLCAGVRRVVVRRKTGTGEDGPYEVFDLLADLGDRRVEFPSPYFTTYTDRESAAAMAGRIARTLSVGVTWEEKPE